jgi:hypothetical protein
LLHHWRHTDRLYERQAAHLLDALVADVSAAQPDRSACAVVGSYDAS